MSEDAIAKVDNAESWNDFCDLLKKAGDVILRDDLARSTFDRAEGHRYLGRLLRAGLQSFCENQGPLYPVFRAMPEMVKMGLDNPDNFYLGASIHSHYEYRIRGNRGSIHYMSFAAQNQNFAAREKLTGGAGHLNDAEIETDADGNFEIIASLKEQPGNWLRLAPDTSMVLLRQTFLDRLSETPVTVEIECLDADGTPPRLEPSEVGGHLLGAAMYTIGCSQWFGNWVNEFLEKAPENEFHAPDAEQHRAVGGDPNILFWLGRWALGPDEALIVEAMPPECHYWNFQLGNIWAESLDFSHHKTHVNNRTAHYNDDGSFQLVVAHEDPGHPNWIDTAGHDFGTMGLRWVRAVGHPAPKTKLVKLSEVGEHTA
jgi:hypothetical protein